MDIAGKAGVVNSVSLRSSPQKKKQNEINYGQTLRKINFNIETDTGRMCKKIALKVYLDQMHSNPQAQIKFSPRYLRN